MLPEVTYKMEVNEAERIVIAKPVPSRPTCSNFRSFSELLAGAIDSSPSNESSKIAVTAIRPKTLRLKPMANHVLGGTVSSQVIVLFICFFSLLGPLISKLLNFSFDINLFFPNNLG